MRRQLTAAAALVIGVLGAGCGGPAAEKTETASGARAPEGSEFFDWAVGLFGPLDVAAPADQGASAKVALGRALYNEKLLSHNQKVSCNSCHPLDAWGTTSRPVEAEGSGRSSRLDIPTVYNAAVQVDLFWDGRATSVEEQAKESIKSSLEMAMTDEAATLARLRASGNYEAAFRAAFPTDPDPLSFVNIARALAAFERGLVTPSRWDQFLRGDRDALTPEEKRGLEKFVNSGCSDCHNGVAVGGRMFQVAGEVSPWPLQSDSGRYSATRKRADLFVFRVPPLRNIEKTGPYFDTGVVTDLSEAVRLMARYQRGMHLSESDVQDIMAWLRSLTGEIPNDYIRTRGLAASYR